MTYAVELPMGGPADWATWSAELVARIQALGPGEEVVVSAPSLTRPHLTRKSRMFGIVPAAHADTSPWVRVRRDEDHAVAEFVGSETFGGEFLLLEEEQTRAEALGWRPPGHDLIEERVWSRWFPDDVTQTAYLSRQDAQAAADLVTRTFRDVLSLDPQ